MWTGLSHNWLREGLLGDQAGYTPSDKKKLSDPAAVSVVVRGGIVRTMTEGWLHTHTWGGTDVAWWEIITWFSGENDAFIRDALVYSMLHRGDASGYLLVGADRVEIKRAFLFVFWIHNMCVWKVRHVR